MKLQLAATDDLQALISLRLGYLRTDYTVLSPQQERQITAQLEEYFPGHLGRDCFAYLAEEQGAAVACAFLILSEKPANPSFPTGKTGTLMNVYTLPGHRRRGYASALVERIIADAQQMRLSYLELKATEDGLPLYQKLGFLEEASDYTAMRLVLI